ncbi:putative lipid II flippase FtsW [Patescibacteria group bacterium]|nr:putative lipid II flippase FtsW [Patescibacteria group bacterium]
MDRRRRKKWGVDPVLLGTIVLLVFLGILILASVSASFSLQTFGTTYYFLNHQILLGLLPGLLVGAMAFFFVSPEMIKKWSFALLLANILLLILVFLPGIGSPEGAHRWIYIGSQSFQPSELLKLTFILYLASLLAAKVTKHSETSKKKEGMIHHLLKGKEALFPFVVVTGIISFLLIQQPDASTLGVIGLTGIIMYFVAGTPLWHTPLIIFSGLGLFYFLIKIAPYRFSRIQVFFDPLLDPLGQGYQIKQALIGIGSGGLTGIGLGLSFQKFGFLPEPISDSIFAVVAEELGFIGAVFLVMLFLFFAWRSFALARKIEDPFAKIATVGIASWITLQAFINMGSITGLLPLTGIPLPFISYGGSALVVELIAMGILLKLTSKSYTMR